MKRHPALQDLSRDHHHFLLQCRNIRWCVEGDRRALPFEVVLRGFLRTWEQEVVPHLEEEETLFLPFYRRYASPLQAQHEAQIRADHEFLRMNVAELMRMQEAGEPIEALLSDIGRKLHDHVRFEERLVFKHVQTIMSDEALHEIGAMSLAFREAQRPNAIGPRKEEVCEI